jgi:gas vesicle protein
VRRGVYLGRLLKKGWKRIKEQNSHRTDLIIAAVIGGVLGAAAGVLLAPKREYKEPSLTSIEGIKSYFSEDKRNNFSGNPLVWSGVGGTLLGAVAGLLLTPKPGSEIRHLIADTYQQVADTTQDLVNSFNDKSKEIAHMASLQSTEWAGKALDLSENLLNEAKNWADIVKDAASKAKHHAMKFKDDVNFKHKFNEILEWAHKAEALAESVLKEMLEWVQSIRRAVERFDVHSTSLSSSNGTHNAITDVMDWAAVGIDIWQKMKNKRR